MHTPTTDPATRAEITAATTLTPSTWAQGPRALTLADVEALAVALATAEGYTPLKAARMAASGGPVHAGYAHRALLAGLLEAHGIDPATSAAFPAQVVVDLHHLWDDRGIGRLVGGKAPRALPAPAGTAGAWS